MASRIAPFELVETDNGSFSLLLSDFDDVAEVFEEAGLEGGGYDWEAIAKHVVETVAPELEGKLDYDPEASMFCAYGKDRGALEALGKRLAKLFRDHEALGELIEEMGPDSFDD